MNTIPFHGNTPENTHCFQACIKMILDYFEPYNNITIYDLEESTHKLPGMATWNMAGLLWLQDRGYEVKNIELFDYTRFANEGYKYLIEIWGQTVADHARDKTDIPSEQKIALQFANSKISERRIPTWHDLEDFLKQGYLVIAQVNSRYLNRKEGYNGHFVLIYDLDKYNVHFHDPGGTTTHHPNRQEPRDHFYRAWGDPDEKALILMAIKKP